MSGKIIRKHRKGLQKNAGKKPIYTGPLRAYGEAAAPPIPPHKKIEHGSMRYHCRGRVCPCCRRGLLMPFAIKRKLNRKFSDRVVWVCGNCGFRRYPAHLNMTKRGSLVYESLVPFSGFSDYDDSSTPVRRGS